MRGRCRLAPDARLLWRRWADEFVVYNDASGDTHLFEEVSGILLQRIAEGPADFESLRALAAETLGVAADDIDPATIDQVIDELHRLGLVDRVAA
jgi:PqqD family protein of HPr-rel-A system